MCDPAQSQGFYFRTTVKPDLAEIFRKNAKRLWWPGVQLRHQTLPQDIGLPMEQNLS